MPKKKVFAIMTDLVMVIAYLVFLLSWIHVFHGGSALRDSHLNSSLVTRLQLLLTYRDGGYRNISEALLYICFFVRSWHIWFFQRKSVPYFLMQMIFALGFLASVAISVALAYKILVPGAVIFADFFEPLSVILRIILVNFVLALLIRPRRRSGTRRRRARRP